MLRPKIETAGLDVYPPKPASWLLADWVAKITNHRSNVLDACAGSGVVGLSAGLNHSKTSVTAIDMSEQALKAVQHNANLNGLHVRTMLGDMYGPVKGMLFDIVAIHPPAVPYIKPESWKLSPGMSLATNGGPDGSDLVVRSIFESRELLSPGGSFLLLLPHWCNVKKAWAAFNVTYGDAWHVVDELHDVEFFPAVEGQVDGDTHVHIGKLAEEGIIELHMGKSRASVVEGRLE